MLRIYGHRGPDFSFNDLAPSWTDVVGTLGKMEFSLVLFFATHLFHWMKEAKLVEDYEEEEYEEEDDIFHLGYR